MERLIPQEYITTLNIYARTSWRDLNIISQLGNEYQNPQKGPIS